MHVALTLAAIVLFAVSAAPAFAQQDEASLRSESRRSELPESVLRAERQTGGEVLRAESMQRDGREVYRLKVLTPDGRVRIMRDDPRERRREAWRESRADSGRDAMPEPNRRDEAASRRDDFRDDRNNDTSRRNEPSTRAPAELAVPETLPPPDRGDRY